ncbi:hypothetical protein OG244_07780 [Streptomyces brevispora]|uniref:hypothetical protein n=1 Tax=Streptomyces brevispora TaxID=887462 RepID=UPI002E2F28F7|nr:hypothetical protein [Streptomyces brevispora]
MRPIPRTALGAAGERKGRLRGVATVFVGDGEHAEHREGGENGGARGAFDGIAGVRLLCGGKGIGGSPRTFGVFGVSPEEVPYEMCLFATNVDGPAPSRVTDAHAVR